MLNCFSVVFHLEENGGNTINTSWLHSCSHQRRMDSITHCPTSLLGTAQQARMNSQAGPPILPVSSPFPPELCQWHFSPLSIISFSTSFSPLPVSPSHYLPPTLSPAFHGCSFHAFSPGRKGLERRGCPAALTALTAAAALSCLN